MLGFYRGWSPRKAIARRRHQALVWIALALLLLIGSSLAQTPTPTGDDFLILTEEQFYELGRSDDGAILLTWAADGRVQGQLFSSGEARSGEEFVITPNVAGSQSPFDVVAHPDGGFLVFWGHGRNQGNSVIRGLGTSQVSSAGEVIGTGRFLIEEVDEFFQRPSGGIDGNGNMIVTSIGWEPIDELNNIEMRRFDGEGDLTDFQVLFTQEYYTYVHSSEVAASPAGQFVVSWSSRERVVYDYFGVNTKIYEPEGPPIADLFSSTHSGWIDLEATWSPQGEFVISTLSTAYDFGVRGFRFDQTGSPIPPVIEIGNTYYGGYQSGQATDPYGNFIIVWREGMERTQLNGRMFGPDGVPIGEQFEVNSTAEGRKVNPQLKANEAGFLVTWAIDPSVGVQDPTDDTVHGRWFDTFLVFRDGFESGDLTAWDKTLTP